MFLLVKIFPKKGFHSQISLSKVSNVFIKSPKSISHKCFNVGLIRKNKSYKKFIKNTLKVVIDQNFVNLRSASMKYADIFIQYLRYICKHQHISYTEQSKHLNYKL